MVPGPSWDAVVLPLRLFTISLLFRMSNKISDACTEAAGEAGLIVVAASVVAHWARTARAGTAPTLIVAGATAAAVILAASRVRPDTFLGPHGAWAAQQAQDMLRHTRPRGGRTSAAEWLAPVREASPE